MNELKNKIIELKREKKKLIRRLKEIEKAEKIILISLFDDKLAIDLLESDK